MPDEILVFAEHQAGRIARPTWEAMAAGQRLAQDLGLTVSAVILGANVSSPAAQVASGELAEVLVVDSPQLEQYTPDGYSEALGEVVTQRKPRLVLFSHTYQVRDFVPKLGAALNSAFLSDCLSCRNEGGRLIFVRQIFQG